MNFEAFQNTPKPKKEVKKEEVKEKPAPVEAPKPDRDNKTTSLPKDQLETQQTANEAENDDRTPEEVEKDREQIAARMKQGASELFNVLSKWKSTAEGKKLTTSKITELMEHTIFKDNLPGFRKFVGLYVMLYGMDKLKTNDEFVGEFIKLKVVNELMSFELASKAIEHTFQKNLERRERMEQNDNAPKAA